MDADLAALLERFSSLKAEIENRIDARREQANYRLHAGRAVFERQVRAQHLKLRKGILAFLRASRLVDFVVIAPVTYSLLIPFALLDIAIWVYQSVCFPLWKIPRVRRADYIVIDRHRLPYLNGIQKLNCMYCSYANGLIALVREVAGRTEAYWCPIKHALRTQAPHEHYVRFLDYGDAAGFVDRAEAYRDELRAVPNPKRPPPAGTPGGG